MVRRAAPTVRQSHRYLEKVPEGAPATEVLLGVWQGASAEEDERSMQQEHLELRVDGTFTHSLMHEMSFTGGSRSCSQSSCTGRWHLSFIKFLGADVDAAGADREITFERSAGSQPLLADRLVVCGVNPRVNGFIGSACRLYPIKAVNAAVTSTTRPQLAADQQAIPSKADAMRVAEATGRSVDACFAALIECNCDMEEAVARILDTDEGTGEAAKGIPGLLPQEEQHLETQWQAASVILAEATGHSREHCLAALQASGGNEEAAAVQLLEEPLSKRPRCKE